MESFPLPPDWDTAWKWENYPVLSKSLFPNSVAHSALADSGMSGQGWTVEMGLGWVGSGYSVCFCTATQARPLGNTL